jgi:hypothetical protein
MLVAEDFFSWNARENKAIARLCGALDEAVITGRPAPVDCYPESLTNREFVAIAVDLCKRAELSVAVLGNQRGNTLTFVPLRAARPVARHALAPGKAFGPLAAAAR